MDKAAPQAAEGTSAGDTEKALGVLHTVYLDEFTFGYDPEHDPENPWWVIRDGRIGSLLTADSPEELGRQLEDVYGGAPS